MARILKSIEGQGLGLSISQRLVTLMGGDISLQRQLSSGSTFTIKLTDVDISALAMENENKEADPQLQIEFYPSSILIVDGVTDNPILSTVMDLQLLFLFGVAMI